MGSKRGSDGDVPDSTLPKRVGREIVRNILSLNFGKYMLENRPPYPPADSRQFPKRKKRKGKKSEFPRDAITGTREKGRSESHCIIVIHRRARKPDIDYADGPDSRKKAKPDLAKLKRPRNQPVLGTDYLKIDLPNYKRGCLRIGRAHTSVIELREVFISYRHGGGAMDENSRPFARLVMACPNLPVRWRAVIIFDESSVRLRDCYCRRFYLCIPQSLRSQQPTAPILSAASYAA
jgi:hypothetical protein